MDFLREDVERDVFNEKPSKEEMVAATQDASYTRISECVIIHTTMGDIQVNLFPKEWVLLNKHLLMFTCTHTHIIIPQIAETHTPHTYWCDLYQPFTYVENLWVVVFADVQRR